MEERYDQLGWSREMEIIVQGIIREMQIPNFSHDNLTEVLGFPDKSTCADETGRIRDR